MNPAVMPPRLARILVERFAPPTVREHLVGDLDEHFQLNVTRYGGAAARRRYWWQALAVLRHWPVQPSPRRPRVPTFRESSMSAMFHDLRFTTRQLVRQPSYLVIAVMSLALAIAANGIVFGLVNGLILNPFSYPEPSRLVSISGAFPTLGREATFIEQHSPGEVEDLAAIPVIEKLGAWDLGNRVLSHGEIAERFFTALVLRDPGPALGVPMTIGRGFTPEELAPGGPKVAVISHRIWVRLFGSDPAIIGKAVRVNTDVTTIVGVLGAGTPLVGTDLWIPWGADPAHVPRNSSRLFTVVARLKGGATLADVNAALATVSLRAKTTYVSEFPEYADWRLATAPWSEAVTGQLLPAGVLLLGAGVIVLLVACANLASLMLARLATRQRELAVRRALGASPWRLTGLLLLEGLLVACLGGAAGIGLAAAGLNRMPALLPEQASQIGFDLQLNSIVIAYCLATSFAAALLTVALPAWQTRKASSSSLAESGRGTAGPARQRGRRVLNRHRSGARGDTAGSCGPVCPQLRRTC